MIYDAIIAGAGPAGSTLARRLAGAGLEVLLLEKETMPRDKPCGGGISAKTAALLDFPWQEAVEDTIHTVVFCFKGRGELAVRPETAPAYMVMRDRFDLLLMQQAVAAGARVLEGTPLQDVVCGKNRVQVTAGGKTFEGRIFAGADGINGASARLLGLTRRQYTGPGLEAEIECPSGCPSGPAPSFKGVVKIDCGAVPWGYGWVFPKKNHLSAGVWSSRRIKGLKQHLARFLDGEGLARAQIISLRGCAIPAGGGRKAAVHNRLSVLLGDAAGLADPLTGEGIYYAVKSAHLAADAILENEKDLKRAPSRYQELVDSGITRHLAAARRVSAVFYTFPAALYALVEKHPEIAGQACSVLYDSSSYTGVKKDFVKLIRSLSFRKKAVN